MLLSIALLEPFGQLIFMPAGNPCAAPVILVFIVAKILERAVEPACKANTSRRSKKLSLESVSTWISNSEMWSSQVATLPTAAIQWYHFVSNKHHAKWSQSKHPNQFLDAIAHLNLSCVQQQYDYAVLGWQMAWWLVCNRLQSVIYVQGTVQP